MSTNTLRLVTCPNCGFKVEPSITTCPNCGYPLKPTGGFLLSNTQSTKTKAKKKTVEEKKYEDIHIILEYLLENEIKPIQEKVIRAEENVKFGKVNVQYYFETESKIDFIYVYKKGLFTKLNKIIRLADTVSNTTKKIVNIVILFEKKKEKLEKKVKLYQKQLAQKKNSVTLQYYYYTSFVKNEAED